MKSTDYIVKNVTKHVVTLTDLKVVIEPGSEINLEKVARRIDVERSVNLVQALKQGILKWVKIKLKMPPMTKEEIQSLVREETQKNLEENQVIDMTKIQETIRRQINRSLKKNKENPDKATNFNEVIDAIKSLQNSLESIPNNQTTATPQYQNQTPEVDIREVVNITQKGIEKITSEIQGEETKKPKKIKLNTDASKLAEELE